MESMIISIRELMLSVGVVLLLDLCRVAVKIIWHDIKKLDEAEEKENVENGN